MHDPLCESPLYVSHSVTSCLHTCGSWIVDTNGIVISIGQMGNTFDEIASSSKNQQKKYAQKLRYRHRQFRSRRNSQSVDFTIAL